MTMRLLVSGLFSGVILTASTVQAGQSAASIAAAGMPEQCSQFGAKVSASEGNWGSVNRFGCLGAFQFCPGTFERYYSGSASSFLSSPSSQVSAWTQYEKDSWAQAQKAGSTSLIGQQVCYGGKCVTVDQSAILMACQFGCGSKGKLANYIANGGHCVGSGGSSSTNDGNGVCIAQYIVKGAGYDVSCFTGQKSTGGNCPDGGATTPGSSTPPTNAPTLNLPANAG
jgi:hypothetical protein